jgi:hypothetical protein
MELWPREVLSGAELAIMVAEVRNLYWIIRNARRGMHDARHRQVYRKIGLQKTPTRSRRCEAKNSGFSSLLSS